MADKYGQDDSPPPAYGQPTHNATPSQSRAQGSYYAQPSSSFASAPVSQQPNYHGPPTNNFYMSPCAQGHHVSSLRFGLCGILAAIFCFPIGFICMCLDTERVCARCGIRL